MQHKRIKTNEKTTQKLGFCYIFGFLVIELFQFWVVENYHFRFI